MAEDPDRVTPKFFDAEDIKALKKQREQINKNLGIVNTGLYGLMILACVILIIWVVIK